jgi:hypothetical protein
VTNFFPQLWRSGSRFELLTVSLNSRGGNAIQPGHFRSDGAPFSQIRREVFEEGLLLEVREHILH